MTGKIAIKETEFSPIFIKKYEYLKPQYIVTHEECVSLNAKGFSSA